ncbi:MAG: hypothetical protein R3Y64_08785 [Peptostreptococcaceae bacterium]
MRDLVSTFKTREELVNKLPMRNDLIREFDARQGAIKEIVKLEESKAIKNELMEFTAIQLQRILIGLELGLDVSTYANLKLDIDQMEQIFYGLQDGLDVTLYNNPKIADSEMMTIRHAIKEGMDVTLFNNPNLNIEQLHAIKHGIDEGVDVTLYNSPNNTAEEMNKMKDKLINELNNKIAKEFNISLELIKELEESDGLEFMRLTYMRKGYNEGFDVVPFLFMELDPWDFFSNVLDDEFERLKKEKLEQSK